LEYKKDNRKYEKGKGNMIIMGKMKELNYSLCFVSDRGKTVEVIMGGPQGALGYADS
jgi:hypothetical protein